MTLRERLGIPSKEEIKNSAIESLRIDHELSRIAVWQGTKSEYEEYVGYKVEFVRLEPLGIRHPYVMFDASNIFNPISHWEYTTKQKFLDTGVEALVQSQINVNYGGIQSRVYAGIPVRKTRK
ncbi:MAG: hypothetical protein AABW41_03825 [Nanoarchaeota archaeon]|mgnify:FL=1